MVGTRMITSSIRCAVEAKSERVRLCGAACNVHLRRTCSGTSVEDTVEKWNRGAEIANNVARKVEAILESVQIVDDEADGLTASR